MNEYKAESDDDISLVEIYQFLREGWKTIAGATVLVSALGTGAALTLPSKFLASASIEPARVLGSEVESISVLAEKMRSPTYYSPASLEACGVSRQVNPAESLTKALKPAVGKQSSFVLVSYKSSSVEQSTACLNAVLKDVNRNQQQTASRQVELATATLNKEKEKLKDAEEFLVTLSNRVGKFDFKETQFSASSLLIVTLQSRQSEITELKTSIQRTQLLLTEPQTKPASFAMPVYAANTPVEPKRSLIALVSVFAGGFVGLLLLVMSRALQRVKNAAPAAALAQHPQQA